jgi:hypothetical protein
MSQEYREFRTGDLIYEIIDGTIHRQGIETNIKFIGVCPAERITQICEEHFKNGKVFGETRTSKDSSGKTIYELLFYEKINMGELEEDIEKGDCIIGKPLGRQYELWISPKITFIK